MTPTKDIQTQPQRDGVIRSSAGLGRWKFVKPSQIISLDAWILHEWRYGQTRGFRILGWEKEWVDNAS